MRFNLLKYNYVFDCKLDKRLSFKANFKLLSKLVNKNLNNCRVYDFNKKVFLNLEIPISCFNIKYLMTLYLL